MIERGHEIADHGWKWRTNVDYTGPDDEAEGIRKGIRKMQEITGRKDVPAGWYIGSRFLSHKSSRAKVHREEQTPLLYCSDCYNADLPYWIPSPLTLDGEKDEGMLMIPYSLVNNDHRFIANGYCGWVTAQDCFEQLKAEFDFLCASDRLLQYALAYCSNFQIRRRAARKTEGILRSNRPT